MWIVVLIKSPKINNYRSDFFPRRFRYKRDALELVKEVRAKDGEAEIRRE